MRIAVLSDVHANSSSLSIALSKIEKLQVDKVVFLGDLLTYGCDVEQTIDLLSNFSISNDVSFVKGNHDEIYFNMQAGLDYHYKPFPDFIEESVTYTHRLLPSNFCDLFDWKESIVLKNILFTHANGLTYGDWSYLNTDSELIATATELRKTDFIGGVFGHTHRPVFCEVKQDKNILKFDNSLNFSPLENESCFILNSGSIGQPRGKDANFILVEVSDVGVLANTIFYDYEINDHLVSIANSNLTEPTKNKLLSYFK